LKHRERELQVLRFVDENEGCTSGEVAEGCGISKNNAVTRLLYYYRSGWLSRSKEPRGEFRYELSKSGRNRKAWLEENL